MDVRENMAPEQELKKGKILARVINEKNGIQNIENVRAIRILSKDYVVLIMEDYTSTLGQVDGTVTVISDDGEAVYENINGFYKQQNNVFTLLIAEENGWVDKI